jgi:hypothetical protein
MKMSCSLVRKDLDNRHRLKPFFILSICEHEKKKFFSQFLDFWWMDGELS